MVKKSFFRDFLSKRTNLEPNDNSHSIPQAFEQSLNPLQAAFPKGICQGSEKLPHATDGLVSDRILAIFFKRGKVLHSNFQK